MIKKQGIYPNYIKRSLDVICAFLALVVLSPLMIVIAIFVRVNLGRPVLFKQKRPGKMDNNGREKIYTIYKYRTMRDIRDAAGNLLPDEARLTKFGKALRSTSLDELPELINILKGDMSMVGPRPQLVRDLVFMSDEQRMRHMVRPGLSGLAQVHGRNRISWEDKFQYDLQYIENITFLGDWNIIFLTLKNVLNRKDICMDGMETAEDLGIYLLRRHAISQEEFDRKSAACEELLKQ